MTLQSRQSNLSLSLHCLPLALLFSCLYSRVIQVPIIPPVRADASEYPQKTCSAEFLSEPGCRGQEEVGESFSEELLLRPLPDGKILAHFHFTHKLLPRVQRHFTLFPKAIAQLVNPTPDSRIDHSILHQSHVSPQHICCMCLYRGRRTANTVAQ